MTTQSSILAWRTHGQRSLADYSPRGCKESDTTEKLSTQASTNKYIYIFYISHMIVFFSEYLGGNSRYPLLLNICSCDPKDRTLFTTHTVTESQEM